MKEPDWFVLRAEDVEWTLTCEPEDLEIRGNAMASGDDALDKEIEDEIIARLENGDQWAWCCVHVTAKWRGLEGCDTLGGCSYKDEADFMAGGYYDDMRMEALERLNLEVEAALLESMEMQKALAELKEKRRG